MTSRPAGPSADPLHTKEWLETRQNRPAPPESETPETDAVWDEVWRDEFMKSLPDTLYDHARSLERRLSLAQTEIKGHMRVEEELKAEIELQTMRVVGCSVAALGYWKEGDSLHADYNCVAVRDVAKLRAKYDEAQARIAELEKDAARWRKGVSDGEFPIRRSGQWMHVSRTSGRILTGETPEEVIDAALKDRA